MLGEEASPAGDSCWLHISNIPPPFISLVLLFLFHFCKMGRSVLLACRFVHLVLAL